ncbi:uncharacterized protein [Narcine bancroftii]|uniref:uncharacterized protein isoform X2 n=1 Tax=Narcine bancroftii TaxID=1343680 RepID=UPI00383209BC
MCAGAIDGSHIPIVTPSMDPAAYYNCEGWHSVVLQAVVDHNFCFSDMFVRWPGHTHDARVLANSSLDRKTEQQTGYLFACDVSKNVDGVEVQAHLVGDVAYRLRTS